MLDLLQKGPENIVENTSAKSVMLLTKTRNRGYMLTIFFPYIITLFLHCDLSLVNCISTKTGKVQIVRLSSPVRSDTLLNTRFSEAERCGFLGHT